MIVYFVRHGESLGNISSIHQPQDCELSDEGLRQADQLALRFQDISVDAIISSPIMRTKQTAAAIAAVTKVPIEWEPRIEEIRRPSLLVGKKTNSPEATKVWKQVFAHADDPNYHYADEENFFDVQKRIASFLADLPKRHEANLVVVSHGHALRLLFGLMLFGDTFTQQQFRLMIDHIKISNTGVTVCEYEDSGSWRILTLNDYAHLLE